MICSRCGASQSRDEAVERDGFVIDPDYRVLWQGRAVNVSGTQREILYSLAASVHTMTNEALIARTGLSGDSNVLHVAMSKLRTKFRDFKIPFPVQTVWGVGYRWGLQ
jgi:DNA-binding response OmpR family regulator